MSYSEALDFHHLVTLPFVKLQDWRDRGFDQLPTTQPVVVQEDLQPQNFRERIEKLHQKSSKPNLSTEQWDELMQDLGSTGSRPQSGLKLLQYTGTPPTRSLGNWPDRPE